MFKFFYDALSHLWSWRWPVAEGEITAIDTETFGRDNRLRLFLAYKFSIGEDGPYCGEAHWAPAFSIGEEKTIRKAIQSLELVHRVRVRYRADDPSVNVLEGGVRKLLKDSGM